MNKQKIKKFLQSFVTIPMLSIVVPLTGITPIQQPVSIPALVLNSSVATVDNPVITTQDTQTEAEHAKAIDTFLESRNSVLAGYGMKFVTEAEKNGIDWRLVVSISGVETTFARPESMCKNPKAQNNPFGWGSCKIGFTSIDQAIEVVSANLGGNNPVTAQHYDGKTTLQILKKYNSIIPTYSARVIRIMKMIDPTDPIN